MNCDIFNVNVKNHRNLILNQLLQHRRSRTDEEANKARRRSTSTRSAKLADHSTKHIGRSEEITLSSPFVGEEASRTGEAAALGFRLLPLRHDFLLGQATRLDICHGNTLGGEVIVFIS